MSLLALSPSTATIVSGAAPNHRPSGVNPFVRIGSPHAVYLYVIAIRRNENVDEALGHDRFLASVSKSAACDGVTG
jgi:hypothetical protein